MVKFRHTGAIPAAALVAFLGAIPLAAARWYLLPILLVPLAITLWAIRSGTDADSSGLSVRALLGRRRLPWDQVTGFVPVRGGVQATLTSGAVVPLPAVRPRDLPKLVEASGQPLTQ